MGNYLNQPVTIFDKYFTQIKVKGKGNFKGSLQDDNARFTTVPLYVLSDQVWIRYQCL